MNNRVTEAFAKSADGAQYADQYLNYLSEVMAALDRDAISAFAEALLDARRRDARVFFLGNGGSAATASHWVNDLTRHRDRPWRAIGLTDNVAVMSAYANDFGYDLVFTMQLENLMEPGDVVVAISASGNSPNVISAVEYANAKGGITVGLTGFTGGKLAEVSQIVVHAPTNTGEYGPAEDIHMILDHLVTSYLEQVCAAGE